MPSGLQREAELHHPARADPRRERGGRASRDQGPDRERDQRRAGVERAEPQRALQIQRQHEQDAELAQRDDQRRDVADAEARDREQAQVDDDELARVAAASARRARTRVIEIDRRARTRPAPARSHRSASPADRGCCVGDPPAVGLALDQAEHERAQPEHERQLAGQVKAARGVRVGGLRHHQQQPDRGSRSRAAR